MATGSGWQQYYCPAGPGKFSSSSATSAPFQAGIAMEYTQDLHLKMSKKIAQLTKVRSASGSGPGPGPRSLRAECSDPRLRPCAVSLRCQNWAPNSVGNFAYSSDSVNAPGRCIRNFIFSAPEYKILWLLL